MFSVTMGGGREDGEKFQALKDEKKRNLMANILQLLKSKGQAMTKEDIGQDKTIGINMWKRANRNRVYGTLDLMKDLNLVKGGCKLIVYNAGNTRLERTADLREKDQHIFEKYSYETAGKSCRFFVST